MYVDVTEMSIIYRPTTLKTIQRIIINRLVARRVPILKVKIEDFLVK